MVYLYEPPIISRSSLVVEEAHTYTPSNGGTVTLDLSNGSYQRIVPNGAVSSINIANTVTGASDYAGAELTLDVEQPTSGNMTVSWGQGVLWSGVGSPPTLSNGVRQVDQIKMRVIARKNYDGSVTNILAADVDINKFTASAEFNTYATVLASASEQYLEVNSTSALDKDGSSPFSISAWVNPTTHTGGDSSHVIFGKQSGAGNYEGYSLYFTNSGTEIELSFVSAWSNNKLLLEATLANGGPGGSAILPTGSWSHVAVVFTNKTTAGLYVNGAAISMNSVSSSLTGSISNTNKFTVGSGFGTNPGYEYNGKIDEVSFWDKALSGSDVSDIYNSGTPTDLTGSSDLVSWWRFGDDMSDDLTSGSGQITDQVGSNNLIPHNTSNADFTQDIP